MAVAIQGRVILMLNDDDPMPFGTHKDKPMSEVPAKYLLWLWNDGKKHEVATNDVARYISDNMDALQQEAPDIIVD